MLLDEATLEASSQMEPSIAEELRQRPRPVPDYSLATQIQAAMAAFEEATVKALGPPDPRLTEFYEAFEFRDGTPTKLKAVRPTSKPAQGRPLVALLFGGGFICGSLDQVTALARTIALVFDAVVVSLPYRLAPQHKFPTQQLDAFDGLKWAAAHASDLGADPSTGFVVGGASAGGLCAASLARMAQEEPFAFKLTGQWLACPGVLEKDIVPEKYKKYFVSREQNANAPTLTADGLAALKKHTGEDATSPIRFPTLSKAPLSDLPRAYFQVNGMDPLRDDGLIYEEMLKEAGVKTRIDFYPGCPHGHWESFRHLEVGKKAWGDNLKGFGWLLDRPVDIEEGMRSLGLTSP